MSTKAVPGLARACGWWSIGARADGGALSGGRVLLDETAREVLERCDAGRDVRAIAADLAGVFDGVSLDDVSALIEDLVARRMLSVGGARGRRLSRPPDHVGTNRQPVPVGLLAELTYRCPLRCPYCSNPVNLDAYAGELTTGEWRSALDQARELGVLQVHLSGGEPLLRPDLAELVPTRPAGPVHQPDHQRHTAHADRLGPWSRPGWTTYNCPFRTSTGPTGTPWRVSGPTTASGRWPA